MRIFTTRTYERAVRKLLREADRRAMEAAVVANPAAAPIIRGTGGLRNRQAGPDAIYLLTAYAKADQEDLSPADRKVLSRLAAAIKEEERDR